MVVETLRCMEKKRRSFKRMGLSEREELAILQAKGKSIREISRIMGRSHSTLSRELRYHSTFHGKMHYSPCGANNIARMKRRKAGRKKVLDNPDIRAYVEEKIKIGWAPEIVSGRLRIDKPGCLVSHETIYQYVYDQSWDLVGYLPRRHRWRKPKSNLRKTQGSRIPNRLSIDVRPDVINQREEFGHWESDLLVSHQSKNALNVMVERKSRYVQVIPIPDKSSVSASQAILSRLSILNPVARRSITYDNGLENAKHEEINRVLNTQSYFCNPYHSWEKGSVENVNGLIRRYIPKKTDLSLIPDEQISYIETQINDRPKKCLAYKTPKEVFNSYLELVH